MSEKALTVIWSARFCSDVPARICSLCMWAPAGVKQSTLTPNITLELVHLLWRGALGSTLSNRLKQIKYHIHSFCFLGGGQTKWGVLFFTLDVKIKTPEKENHTKKKKKKNVADETTSSAGCTLQLEANKSNLMSSNMQYTWQCTKTNKIPRWELKNVPVGKWAKHYFANIVFHQVLCLLCRHALLLRCSMPLSCLSWKQHPSRLTWGVTLNHWMVVHLECGIATAAREAYYVVLAIVYSDGGLINGDVIRPNVEDDPYLSLILWADHNNVKRRFEATAAAKFHARLDNKWTSVITGCRVLIRNQSTAPHKHTYFHEKVV